MIYTTSIFASKDSREILFHFDKEYEALEMFFATDVSQFHRSIVRDINKVLTGKTQEEDGSGNACSWTITKDYCSIEYMYKEDERGFANCRISTVELLELIKEWRKQNKLLQKNR